MMKCFAVVLAIVVILIVSLQFLIDEYDEMQTAKEDCIGDVHNLEERLEFTYKLLFVCEDSVYLYNQANLGDEWRELNTESREAIQRLVCENYACEEFYHER